MAFTRLPGKEQVLLVTVYAFQRRIDITIFPSIMHAMCGLGSLGSGYDLWY